tara:strand:- start:52 stop:561 length:510 start_codon:yes stop_codon:yes gene_type:complete
MHEPIVNKVASSPLVTIDINNYKAEGPRTFIDVSQWLEEASILREKPFRARLKQHDWHQYTNHHIALDCTSESILPAWASLLVTSYLSPISKTVVFGSLEDLEKHLFLNTINKIDLNQFRDKPLIIKGCSDSNIPEDAYIQLLKRLQTVAKSLFYGEACSSVPLWKANK